MDRTPLLPISRPVPSLHFVFLAFKLSEVLAMLDYTFAHLARVFLEAIMWWMWNTWSSGGTPWL